ncbi:MAG: cyclase family protein [Chlorobi bacterium]|nr:cyclase family protein [Chlorobiota bacterium]
MIIRYSAIVDLSHEIHPGIPVWPGDPEVRIRPVASVEPDGYALHELTIGEHSGTHFGAPSHFHAEGMQADAFGGDALVRAAVMIDVRGAVAGNPDYRLGRDDIGTWERTHGTIPPACVVLLCTGWSERWGEPGRYFNAGAGSPIGHYPGFAPDAARFLAEERGVAGLGIDTLGIDAGTDTGCEVNGYWLRDGRFHLENLTNLHLLPSVGVTLFIGVLKIAGGTGGPARVLALA